MKMLSALLALCEGNPPITDCFPSQNVGNGDLGVFFDIYFNDWINSRVTGDLRRYDAHCEVIVMYLKMFHIHSNL